MSWEQAQEDRDYELGAQLGDPRRCPRHPWVKTSDPHGLFDAPCGVCEGEAEASWQDSLPDDPFGDLWAGVRRSTGRRGTRKA